MEYMTSFGKRGEGPEEMVSADCFRFISKDSIWTLDANKMRTTRWKIEQNMNNIIPVETIDMDKRWLGIGLLPDGIGLFGI